MYNDTKHVALLSILLAGTVITPNSSLTPPVHSEYRSLGRIQLTTSSSSILPFTFIRQNKLLVGNGIPPNDFAWVKKLYDSENTSTGEALLITFENVESLIESSNFESCSRLLEIINYEKLKPEVLVGFLRIASSVRLNIRSWEYALEQTSIILRQSGYDPKVVLRGLC